jgi:hypothetical protein
LKSFKIKKKFENEFQGEAFLQTKSAKSRLSIQLFFFQPIDTTKEEFRVYLTKNGILDSLTKVLMECYKEHPEDPITFIKENVSVSLKRKMIIQEWQEKIRELDQEIARLEAELQREKGKLQDN